MRASDPVNRVMSASVLWVDVDAPVREVLDIFVAYPVHHLPVVKDRSVVGMLSSADIMKLKFFLPPPGPARDRLLADKFSIAALMSTPVVKVAEHDCVERAAELMASHAIHALPVVNQHDHLIGIVTTTDIMAGFLGSLSSKAADAGGDAPDGQAATACTPERLAAIEHVLRAARRYLNAGQDERLHAALVKAIERVDHIDERRSGHHPPVLGLDPH